MSGYYPTYGRREADRTPHRVGTAVYNRQTAELLEAAIAAASDAAPYYYSGILNLRFIEQPGLGTFATSKDWRTFYDPQTLRDWTTSEAGAVIIHELEHLLRRHAERSPEGCDHGKFNIAADMEINQRLTGLPAGGQYPATHGMPNGLTAETYYKLLPGDDEQPEPDDGSGDGSGGGERQPGDGSGGSGKPSSAGKPSQCGSAAGGPAGDYETAQGVPSGLKEHQIEQAIRDVASACIGDGPGNEIRAWAESELHIDKSAWMSALASAISGSIAAVSAPDGWVWPMRRDMADMGGAMLPRWTGHQPQCAVIIDTSGSITDEDINMAVAAGQFIAQAAEVTFYGCSTRATNYGPALPGGLHGGGGTDLRVGIDLAIKDGAALVVVITDTYTPWHSTAPDADIIIAGGLGAPENAHVPGYATYIPLAGDR